MTKHIPPTLRAVAFNCARCQVYAKQEWSILRATTRADGSGKIYTNDAFLVSKCYSCGEPTIWHGELMIYPLHATAEPPNEDLPDDIREDFEEARVIANLSPRAAAALLRLAIQKLCRSLGESGENINSDIAALVTKGLPPKVQEALDSVRVIGNEAVHPGSLDLKDDTETVNMLFRLVNFIAQKMITEPREIAEIYSSLPPDKLAGIANRDAKP